MLIICSIYLIRSAITAYYNYRIDGVTNRLKEQQTARSKTIDKLKAATKYNSTQQLLEKYGGAPQSPPSVETPKAMAKSSRTPPSGQNAVQRTNIPPPPTANIQRNRPVPSAPSSPSTPQVRPTSSSFKIQSAGDTTTRNQGAPPVAAAEFAPNAFSTPSQYSHTSGKPQEGQWYDRILDLLLGEDETLPKNRMVLICENCRLVNGQAPPGMKTLHDVGKWRCGSCGVMNGEDDEGTKAVLEMKQRIASVDEDRGKADTDRDEAGRLLGDMDEESDSTTK